ncbi:MAG: sulfatase, partial [Thermoanaerobaculia bacterium]|nr:sulfatase [Thermoanaerobaculia bacterium]
MPTTGRSVWPSKQIFRPWMPVAKCLLTLASVVGALSCGPNNLPIPEGTAFPLLDRDHVADVLVEATRLEFPPATGGNRFLQGWRGKQFDGAVLMMPQPHARLEIATVTPRARVLVLRIKDAPTGSSDTVQAKAEGRSLGSFPVNDTIRIPLPDDLPLGRSPLDLEFGEDSQLLVVGAEIQPAHPAGGVEVNDEAIVQSGWSMVELVRRSQGSGVLVGAFEPPSDPSGGQQFSIVRAGADQTETLFEWRSGLLRRSGSHLIRVPVEPEDGFVRLRFVATGTGAAGTWRDLRWVVPAPPEVARSEPVLRPPQIVVLYVLDALRSDHIGHLGSSLEVSPLLDALAQESVAFSRHRSVAPNTLPSTKSLFTGQAFPRQGGSKLAPEGPETLAEVFAAAGYRTAMFSGNPNVSDGFGMTRGFEHSTEDWLASTPRGYHDSAERVQESALRWLDSLSEGERIFVYVHTLNPHNPYDPPPALRQRFVKPKGSIIEGDTGTLLSIRQHRIRTTEADRERLRDLYRASVAYADQQVHEFVTALEQRYQPPELLLIVTSDHGEELFDHGGVLHGYTLHPEMLNIPLLLRWPTVLAPRVVDSPSDNLDLHETLRSLLKAPPSGRGDGRSLWQLALGGEARDANRVQFASAGSLKGGIFVARSRALTMVWAPRQGTRWGQGEGLGRSRDPEYLFDLAEDPREMHNLAGDRRAEAAWLRSRLFAW